MYKEECIEELKEYLNITANECCKKCQVCCEENNCILTQMKYGFANMFGINFYFKEEESEDGIYD